MKVCASIAPPSKSPVTLWESLKKHTMKIDRLVLSLFIALINLAIFLISVYVENNILDRTLIFTVTCFCLFLSIFNKFTNKISILEVLKTFTMLLLYTFSNGIIFLIILGSIENEILSWTILLLFYALSSTLILNKFFKIRVTLKFLLDLGILTLVSFAIIYSLNSIQNHDYGFPLMCLLWSLTFSIILLRNSIKPSQNRL